MRYLWCVLLIAGVTLIGSSAHATSECESEAIRIAFTYPQVWSEAGSPRVLCGVTQSARPGHAGSYDKRTNTIYMRDGLSAYNRPIAHELGHAWFYNHKDRRRVEKYARIRGFPDAYTMEVNEDYAETFAFALGEWAEMDTPAPYGFKTVAFIPTENQIACLRKKGLLP